MSASNGELFEDLPVPVVVSAPMESPKAARALRPSRDQLELQPCDLVSLLAEDHPARLVWGYVERQDLSPLYSAIRAVEGGSGRSTIASEILLSLSLWLYATLQGVGSARARARLCEAHDAYRWLWAGCG